MGLKKIKFGDKEIDKKEFYSSKQAISLDSVDLDKIVVSNKWKINETTYKYLCGYLNNDVIQPLCVILPQMHGYIKYFDNGGKNMTFVTDNEKVYDKYNEIWEVIRKLLKVKFAVNPVRDDKYLVAKLKIFNKIKLGSLAKWLSVRLRIKWLWVRIPLQSLKLQISRLFRARTSLTFRQL